MAPHVLIAGAGVVGLACAHRLAEAGLRVTLADSGAPGSGTSRTNAGWVSPHVAAPTAAPGMFVQGLRWMLKRDSPLHIAPSLRPSRLRFLAALAANCRPARYHAGLRSLTLLGTDTYALFDRLEETVGFESHHTGMVELFTDEHLLAQHTATYREVRETTGAEFHVLDRSAVRTRLPSAGARVVGGINLPAQRYLDPSGLVDGLAGAVRAAGVEILDNTPVTLHRDGDQVAADLGGARTRFDRYVVAAGVWSNDVLAPLGYRLPLEPGKGYGFDLPGVDLNFGSAVYLSEARVALTPLNAGLRMAGTMAFSGRDESIDPVRANAVFRAGADYFTDWPADPRSARPWMGLRPMTPSGVPLIGPLAADPAVILATGHQMYGVTHALATAELVHGHATGAPAGDRGMPALLPRLRPRGRRRSRP